MKAANSFYGCLKCKIEVLSLAFGGCSHVIFPYSSIIVNRTKQNYEVDLLNRTHGVLGPCFLGRLSSYHPILSTNIDFMHSVCLGVIKKLFTYWFDSTLEKAYCLRSKIINLNIKLKRCRPPNYVTHIPRALDDFKNWRSNEFMNFFLFFAIPVFYEEMSEKYFNHTIILIIAFEHLLIRKISKADLVTIDKVRLVTYYKVTI